MTNYFFDPYQRLSITFWTWISFLESCIGVFRFYQCCWLPLMIEAQSFVVGRVLFWSVVIAAVLIVILTVFCQWAIYWDSIWIIIHLDNLIQVDAFILEIIQWKWDIDRFIVWQSQLVAVQCFLDSRIDASCNFIANTRRLFASIFLLLLRNINYS